MFKTVSDDCEKKDCSVGLEVVIPPQMTDVALGKTMEENGKIIEAIMRLVQTNGIVQSFVMSSALESLYV